MYGMVEAPKHYRQCGLLTQAFPGMTGLDLRQSEDGGQLGVTFVKLSSQTSFQAVSCFNNINVGMPGREQAS